MSEDNKSFLHGPVESSLSSLRRQLSHSTVEKKKSCASSLFGLLWQRLRSYQYCVAC